MTIVDGPLEHHARRLARIVMRLRRLVGNVITDLRYGGFLGGRAYASPFSHLGANDSNNSDYGVLEQIFASRVRADDVLVDVGCGKGRVLNWWLSKGYGKKIYGLEIDPAIAAATAARLRRHRNVTVLAGDAIANIPADATLFYLFNPFDAAVMARFRDRVRQVCTRPADLRIIYFAPTALEVFAGDTQWTMEELAVDTAGLAEVKDRHRQYVVLRPVV
jgi:hypothetical protein